MVIIEYVVLEHLPERRSRVSLPVLQRADIKVGVQVDHADSDVLRYRFRRAWLLGVPVPRSLALRSDAVCRGDDRGWELDSRVSIPWLGELVRYRGRVEPA